MSYWWLFVMMDRYNLLKLAKLLMYKLLRLLLHDIRDNDISYVTSWVSNDLDHKFKMRMTL